MTVVIPCQSLEVLCWFLEHTDFSIIYAGDLLSLERFPSELREVAEETKAMAIDLASTSVETLSRLVGKPVHTGTTAVFRGIDLVEILPSLLETPEVRLADWFLSQVPEFKQMKQIGRKAFIAAIVKAALVSPIASTGAGGVGKHKRMDSELEQIIELHLASRRDKSGRTQAIEELAGKLKLGVGQVAMMVDAVEALDPDEVRRYPKPSKRLAQLWKQRGFKSKLDV